VRGDIENYVDFRMRAAGYRGPKVFGRDSIRLIARTSQGLTRRINILADKALLAAFAKGTHAVTAAEVRRAVRDSEFYRARSGGQKARIAAAALAAGLIIGWATHVLLSPGSAPQRSQASAAPPAATPRPEPAVAPVAPAPVAATPVVPVAAAATAATPAKDPAASAAPAPAARGQVSKAPIAPDGRLARERFDATQEWLRGTPGERYSIQLATVKAGELQQLESFLQKAAEAVPVAEIFVYSVKIDGQQHYRVAYGSFPGPSQAVQAIKSLPPLLAAYQPYARSVERMRSQNRQ